MLKVFLRSSIDQETHSPTAHSPFLLTIRLTIIHSAYHNHWARGGPIINVSAQGLRGKKGRARPRPPARVCLQRQRRNGPSFFLSLAFSGRITLQIAAAAAAGGGGSENSQSFHGGAARWPWKCLPSDDAPDPHCREEEEER